MGTRHLIAVVVKGKYKIAQYGQWDGYPNGQGRKIIRFIKQMKKETFIERLEKVRFLTPDELENIFLECGYTKNERGTFSINSASKKWGVFESTYPELCRDSGAKILDMVYTGKVSELRDDINFASDGLYCEWGYVIDLDNDMLEIYIGGKEDEITPKGQRFSDFPVLTYSVGNYYPIKLVQKISFSNCKNLKFRSEIRKKIRERRENKTISRNISNF